MLATRDSAAERGEAGPMPVVQGTPIGGDWLEVLRECDFTTSSDDVVWFEMTTMVGRIRCVSMSLYFAFF